jgi:hypothetical protein
MYVASPQGVGSHVVVLHPQASVPSRPSVALLKHDHIHYFRKTSGGGLVGGAGEVFEATKHMEATSLRIAYFEFGDCNHSFKSH